MLRLAAIFQQIKGAGWFIPGANGTLFPFPFLWQGWLAFGLFLIALVSTVPLHGDAAWLARVGLCAGYLALSYWTMRRNP